MQFYLFMVAIVVGVLSFSIQAQVKSDVPGAQDHPSIGRYPGTNISQHTVTNYDKYVYPVTVNTRENRDSFESLSVEGHRTTIVYDIPDDAKISLLGVFRSIAKGLKQEGFEQDLSCEGDDGGCGHFFTRKIVPSHRMHELFGTFDEFNNLNKGKVYMLSARKAVGGKSLYVWVVVARDKRSSYGQYAVDVLEEEALHTEEMELSVGLMASAIEKRGQVTLSGVHFETGSDRLSRDSRAALEVIRDFIDSEPNATFLVVGHTDTRGGFDGNQALSAKRANSVTEYLVTEMGVNEKRLRSVGVGYAAPAAPNVDDASRAKNRRVELVLESP